MLTRPGVTSAQQWSLRDACLPFPVPAALRSYFERVDGMPEYEMGPEYIRFWTLDEVLKSMQTSGDCVYFDFADVLIMADILSVRLDRTGDRVVRRRSGRDDQVLAASFEEFIARYIEDPVSIL